ncbi:MAG TPA: homocysteine S-methyltransferase family protein [Telmatospirillum sp.]|nr:homocysteine S-methyltransferase family protein [Telmatospirillum sp.]
MPIEKTQNPFSQALAQRAFLLTEGALIERLRRDPNSEVSLDPDVANASLLYSPAGIAALAKLWRGYIDIAQAHDLGILVCTPTWRANPERLARAKLPAVSQVAADAVECLTTIRSGYGAYGQRIFIGGLIGCKGDAYAPREAMDSKSAERFHAEQVSALAQAGVDVLLAATLPAFSEALGLAQAMSKMERPYLLSFVLRPDGTLLDGMPVADAITRIDDALSPAPSAYLANCVHPLNFLSALCAAEAARPGIGNRLIGLQGNSSQKSPEELDGSLHLDTDTPDAFAAAMRTVRTRFGTHIIGGCCGTDDRHIAALAKLRT